MRGPPHAVHVTFLRPGTPNIIWMDADGTRPAGIRVGSVLGAPVLLRASWFVVVGLVAVAFYPTVVRTMPGSHPLQVLLVAGSFALVLFASVFLHEVAHALTARAVGSPPSFIVLDVWGGHTAFSADLLTPARSIVVAAAGPLANIVLAGTGWALRTQVDPWNVPGLLLFAMFFSNAFVAAFNALPGLPLDGGRILEGVVWAARGERATGTLAAGWGGRLVAAAVAGYAVLWPLLTRTRPDLFSTVWILAVAALLWRGAGQTVRLGQWRRRAPGVTVRSLLRPATGVSADTTVADALALGERHEVSDLVVLDGDGRPTALLDRDAAAGVPPDRAAGLPVGEFARTLEQDAVLTDDLAGDPLVERMQESPHEEYAVLDSASGEVVGVLLWQDVAARVAGR